MTTSESLPRKKDGIHFTPEALADYLVYNTIKNEHATVFDPCFGHGALLFAAHKRFESLGTPNPSTQLFGCDVNLPPKKIMDLLNRTVEIGNLTNTDFFYLKNCNLPSQFDAIIMNPPYIRHHSLTKETKKYLNTLVSSTTCVRKTCDLWAYFILHSLKYIRINGSLGAILPWSFLYSEYSRPVKEYLFANFGEIRIAVIGQQLFDTNQERILLLFADQYGTRSHKIQIGNSRGIPDRDVKWRTIPVGNSTIENLQVFRKESKSLEKLRNLLKFQPLGKCTDVLIGTVTGANNFFIINKIQATELGIPDSFIKPIVRKARDMYKCKDISAINIQDYILEIPENIPLSESLTKYIQRGVVEGYAKRLHCKNRNVWYCIAPKKSPDAFLPYMIKETPTIVLNPDKIYSTNNVHGVYLKNTENIDLSLRWIRFSMLSSLSQLSFEIYSKTYGSGVLKIEPSAAKKALVFLGENFVFPYGIESRVDDLILKDQRALAMKTVDNWFIENLNVPAEEMEKCFRQYEELKNIRLSI